MGLQNSQKGKRRNGDLVGALGPASTLHPAHGEHDTTNHLTKATRKEKLREGSPDGGPPPEPRRLVRHRSSRSAESISKIRGVVAKQV